MKLESDQINVATTVASLPPFKLEEYLSEREFGAQYMFCGSDVEAHSVSELLAMADRESRKLWDNLTLSYTEPWGAPWLRDEISRTYVNKSIGADNIFCLAGAEEGIFCASHALLNRDSHAIVVTPCYQSLEAVPTSICDTTKIPLKCENQWELDINEIKDAIKSNTRLIIINYPHNPTGAVLSKENYRTLVNLAKEQDLWIFSDEVYRGLEFDEKDQLPAIADFYRKGISLGVMSKSYGLPGLRVGWVACQDRDLLRKVAALKHYTSICNSAPAEVLSLIALRNANKILAKNKSLVANNFSLLEDFFNDHSNTFAWIKPKGGCIGFPKLKNGADIEQFADQLLAERGVVILPGTVYDIDGNYFRVGFGRKNMPEALQEFSEFVGP